jgi:hypothetical protein
LALAAFPDIQTKVIEEIDRVCEEAAAAGRTELTYKDDFPKLEYTFGFMVSINLYDLCDILTRWAFSMKSSDYILQSCSLQKCARSPRVFISRTRTLMQSIHTRCLLSAEFTYLLLEFITTLDIGKSRKS